MKFFGIDPGLDGGLAVIYSDQNTVAIPMLTIGTGKRTLDSSEIYYLLKDPPITFCLIEQQQVMPKQGSVSGFTIGKNYGILLGILSALRIPFQEIRAKAWQKAMFVGRTRRGKGDSIALAQQLFPEASLLATERSKKPHDGMAEALLLAELARRLHGGKGTIQG